VTISMEVERLIQAAWEFEYLDEQLSSALREVRSGLGGGDSFGPLLTVSGDHHDVFIGQMHAAITTGVTTAREYKSTLIAIARDHGATDENVREIFRDLEKTIAPERAR
jgi:hypothetical protein